MNDKTISVLLGSALGIIIAVGIVFVVNVCANIEDEKTPIEQETAYNRVLTPVQESFEPGRYDITQEDKIALERIVEGEAGGESFEGKCWVATCLRNAMEKDGLTAEQVRVSYQYSGWKENVSEETERAVAEVFECGNKTHDSVLWFYAPRWCESDWHESQQFVAEIGGHRFFAPKGET